MTQLLGCILIACGCTGLGVWYRQQFELRLKHLRILNQILEMLMSEIRYSKATLPECCKRLAPRLEEPYKQSFLNIFETMKENTGEGFGQVFKKDMELCLGGIPLQKEEKELFLNAVSESGFEDGKMQLRNIEQHNELLKNIIEKQDKETAEKSRMAMCLGAMSGLLLIIILL